MLNVKSLLLSFSSLRGVGPATSKLLTNLVSGNKIFDLLLHKPLRVEKISLSPRLFEVQNDELIILKAKVESHIKPNTNRQPYKVICYTPSGYLNLVFFKIFPSQISKMQIGQEIAILGNLQKLSGENQIIHPQEILPAKDIEKLPKINVVYPLTAGITQKFLSQKIKEILSSFDDALKPFAQEPKSEWLDENLLKQQGWQSFVNSLKNLHYFFSDEFSNYENGRKRLAYDELLSWQIATLLAKNNIKKSKNFSKPSKNPVEDFLESLPFELTKSQLQTISEIDGEIFSNKKMLRLLQGDVGSGKTVVAIAACLCAISQKKQVCVIAPTTVLAKQHLQYFKRFLEKQKINVELLTSATTKKQKAKIISELERGEIDILISTHAALEDDVQFKNLGLAIIDEQHRFGVMQRLKLVEKGEDVDVLLMSATPIPRSLMMALYGDMDISVLSEKPKNRQEIETLVMSAKKTVEVYEAMKRAVLRGEKIYWICPAIEESDEMELISVKKKYEELVKIFGEEKVGLLHGKMKEKEKEKIIAEFSNRLGGLKILVSTTVIEVGIDIPDATVILIENAENFGLSQLHQLRGRVGRSDKKSFCLLLYGEKYGANGRKRLGILRESNDGFFIAEEDLKMRGSGELLGTKQSGFPEFRIADLNFDSDLLKIAHKNAEIILHRDPKLETALGKKYQELLQLFSYDECLKMIDGG
jgi:ATP-dependent DNA helicase RecG